jgi:hypothetical protein
MTLYRRFKQNGITHVGSTGDQLENTQYKKKKIHNKILHFLTHKSNYIF